MSTSTNQDTRLNQIEAIGIKSTTSMITLGQDAPIPRGNISNETLQLLQTAATNLSSLYTNIPNQEGLIAVADKLRKDPNKSRISNYILDTI